MENEDVRENQEVTTKESLEARIQEKIEQEVTRRKFFTTTAKWSVAVIGLVTSGVVASTLQGCGGGSSYSNYANYSNYSNSGYSNISYCNACGHNYSPGVPVSYCNYANYIDIC